MYADPNTSVPVKAESFYCRLVAEMMREEHHGIQDSEYRRQLDGSYCLILVVTKPFGPASGLKDMMLLKPIMIVCSDKR